MHIPRRNVGVKIRILIERSEDLLHLRRLQDSVQPVAANQHYGSGRERNPVVIDRQRRACPDRHRQHVTHRVMLQAVFVQSQRTAYLVDPGLIVRDHL